MRIYKYIFTRAKFIENFLFLLIIIIEFFVNFYELQLLLILNELMIEF